MLLRGMQKYGVSDASLCYMIGDTTSDILAGQNAGCNTILVQTGYGGKEKTELVGIQADFVVKNLLEASKIIK